MNSRNSLSATPNRQLTVTKEVGVELNHLGVLGTEGMTG
jgi:hypothetical protein